MANDAYRVLADTSIPKAAGRLEDGPNGEERYSNVGVAYDAGSVVLAEDISPLVRQRAENGDLDHLLEPISRDEALAHLAGANIDQGVFIPEHEAEEVILDAAGHRTVPKDQLLELKSAGADAARQGFEDATADDADARPNLTAPDRPSLAEVSRGDADDNVPSDSEHVEDEVLEGGQSSGARGLEQPPGVPVGSALAAARGEDGSERKQRSRPRRKAETAQEKPEGDS